MADAKDIYLYGSQSDYPTYIGNQDQLEMSSEELTKVEGMVQPSSLEIMDLPLPEKSQVKNTTAGTIASLMGNIDPSLSFQDHYLDAKIMIEEMGEETARAEAIAKYDQAFQEQMQEAMVDAVQTLPAEDAVGMANDVALVDQDNKRKLAQSEGFETAHILSVKGEEDQAAAERMYYERTIADLTTNTTLIEKGANIAGLFWPDWHWDTAQLTGGDLLSAEEDLKTMILNFQSLPRKQRLEIWPKLVRDVLLASDDNELEASSKLMAFIDPTQEQSMVDTEAFLEKADYGLILAPLAWAVVRGVRSYKTINNVSRAGDNAKAAELNAAALSDESGQVEEAIETSQEVAGMNTTPFAWNNMVPEATDGLSGGTAKTIETMQKRRAQVREQLEPIFDPKNYLFEESLTRTERALLQKEEVRKVSDLQEEYFKAFGHYPTGARISNQTTDGFTVEYELAGVNQTRRVQYTKNAVGEFDALEAGELETILWSPSIWMDKIQRDATEVATRIGFQQSKMLGDLTRAAQTATKGLSRKQKTRVDDVLIAGDEWNMGKGTNFSIEDLKAGITTPNGIHKLDDAEISSYYAQRDIYNALHFMKEGQTYRSLQFKGFKEATVDGKDAVVLPRRQQDLPEALREGHDEFILWSEQGPHLDGTGGIVNASTLNLDDLYTNGFVVTKLRDRVKIGDGEYVEYALVSETRDLRRVGLLNKRRGYVPKAATEGFYFVKQIGDAVVNGKLAKSGDIRTNRMFDNRTDAQAYADELASKDLDADYTYVVRHDRELTMAQMEEEAINEAGGLFTSSRSTHDITFGLDGDRPKRFSATEAMERNLAHISTNIPMNEFRLGLQQRWINSAKGHLVDEGDFNSVIKDEIGTPAHIALTKSREWIQDQLRIPTESERRWSTFARRTAEWMEGKPLLNPLRKSTLKAAREDPFANVRAASFHALLGVFNPAQLWVQAQGASIALSLDPLAWPKLMKQYMGMRAAFVWRKDPEKYKAVIDRLGGEGGEVDRIVKEIDRTGIMDSVRTTADYAAAEKGFGIDRGSVKRALDFGLLPFREGEMFTRGYAYLSARHALKESGDVVSEVLSEEETKRVVQEGIRRMMNLNRANRAQWQKGAISVPLQFKQVFAKFAENMVGSKWTNKEKAKIIAGQSLLYGSAGVPLGSMLIPYAAEMAGVQPGELSDAQVAMAEDGAMGLASDMFFDEQFELGRRGSLVDGFNGLVEWMVLEDAPTELKEYALGPAFTIPSRIMDGISVVAPMLVAGITGEGFDLDDAKLISSEMMDIASSWNNAHKAYTWYKWGEVRDTKGRVLFEIDRDQDLNMLLGKAFGLTPARIDDFYTTSGFKLNYKKMMQEKASSLTKLYLQYYNGKLSEDDTRKLHKQQQWVLQGLEAPQVREVQRMTAKSLLSGRDKENENLRDAIKLHLQSKDSVIRGKSLLFNAELNKEENE